MGLYQVDYPHHLILFVREMHGYNDKKQPFSLENGCFLIALNFIIMGTDVPESAYSRSMWIVFFSMQRKNASTTSGSKCLPLPFLSSLRI